MTPIIADTSKPHVIEEVLDAQRQEALNDHCKRVIDLLGSSFTNKVEAVQELEAIRWTGDWTKDEFWNRLDGIEGYTQAQLAKIPRDWVTYVDLVRQFRMEGEPISKSTYNNLVTAGALIDAINHRNSQAPDVVQLPLPENPSQCMPFMGLLKREDVATSGRSRNLSGFAPEFRVQIENAGKSQPYLPAAEQQDAATAWADCWDALPSDRQRDGMNKPLPPSSKWSQQVLAKAQPDASEKGAPITLPPKPQTIDAKTREAQQRRNEKEAAEFKSMMADIRERQADIKTRNDQQRLRDEIHRKQAEEVDEIKAYVREYSFAINEVLQSSQKLLTFLKKLSNIKGTQYLAEMRAFDLGMVSCGDDVQRFQLMQERIAEIFQLASSSNPPTGIDMTTFEAEAK